MSLVQSWFGHYFMRIYGDQLVYSPAATEELSRLTPHEWDCLRTLTQDYREAEIAELPGTFKSTVRFHLHNVVRKFGCKRRAQAIALAAQLGALGPIGPWRRDRKANDIMLVGGISSRQIRIGRRCRFGDDARAKSEKPGWRTSTDYPQIFERVTVTAFTAKRVCLFDGVNYAGRAE